MTSSDRPPGTHRHRTGRVGQGALLRALVLTAAFSVVEVIGGVLTGSLALLADAGHMLSDVAALSLALAAGWYATRPATPKRSYGYYRLEILAALANGMLLLLIAAYVSFEAFQRLAQPTEVKSLPMLGIAVVGLGVNLSAALILLKHRARSLNTQAAFLHILGDTLGSAGAIVGALVMLTTGWFIADPIISLGIAAIIVFSAWHLMSRTLDILMESTPEHIDMVRVRESVTSLNGVRGIHDLHVWSLTTGFVAMSGHVMMEERLNSVEDQRELLLALRQRLREMGVDHATVQLETPDLPDEDIHCEGDPRCLP